MVSEQESVNKNNSKHVLTIKTESNTQQVVNISPQKQILKNTYLNSENKTIKSPFIGFVQNTGQYQNPSIFYYLQSSTSFIGFSYSKIYFSQQVNGQNIPFSITLLNSNDVKPVGVGKLLFRTNYFIGNISKTSVSSFNSIMYYNIYSHIDLKYYNYNGKLKYEFIVHTGGNPNDIDFQVSNNVHVGVLNNQVNVKSNNNGNIILSENNLSVFQNPTNSINSKFVSLNKNSYSFAIGHYNTSKTLIIDPYWAQFSTYLGGSNTDVTNSVKVDNLGNIFLVGYTSSTDFFSNFNSTKGLTNSPNGSSNIFVVGLNPTGSNIFFTAYLGGNNYDQPTDFVLDNKGDIYITGLTNSTDFYTWNPLYYTNSGQFDAFLTEIAYNTKPYIVFSTYFGGTLDDRINQITLDSSSNIYVTGTTNSPRFPLNSSLVFANSNDAFVSKFTFNVNSLVLDFNYRFNASNDDHGMGITLDSSNDIFVTGYTNSNPFPTVNAYDSSPDGGYDAFLSEFLSNGTGPIYSTYFGGTNNDMGLNIAVYDQNYIILAGQTYSTDLPVSKPLQKNNNGSMDLFISIFSRNNLQFMYGTYFGGSSPDYLGSMAIDTNNNIYLTGSTYSTNFPIKNGLNTSLNGYGDAFITELSPFAGYVAYSSYYGGNQTDGGLSIATYNSNIYVAGYTDSADFPQINSMEGLKTSQLDGFLTILKTDNIVPAFSFLPTNLNYNVGSTGNTLTWTATDSHPYLYFVHRNNFLIDTNRWSSGVPITISVDGLSVGVYAYNITIEDKANLKTSYSVNVTVTNNNLYATPVFYSTPSNLKESSVMGGLSLKWIAIGPNPSNFLIYQNNTLVENSTWSSNKPIILNENWLYRQAGSYIITIVVFQQNGNSIENTVTVTILPNPVVQPAFQLGELAILTLVLCNLVTLGYVAIKRNNNNNNNDPQDLPNVPAGVALASNEEYLFISWIGSNNHPIIQWLLDKKIAILVIFLMRFFRVDSKHHIFIAVASQKEKNFPDSDSWIYQKKIIHVKSKFRPSMVYFNDKLYIAFTSTKNQVILKSLSFINNKWKLEDESIPTTDPLSMKTLCEPSLVKTFDQKEGKYTRLYLTFYSAVTKSVAIYYYEHILWNFHSNSLKLPNFDGAFSANEFIIMENSYLIFNWSSKGKLYSKVLDENIEPPKNLPTSLGASQLLYIETSDNVLKYGLYTGWNKKVKLSKYDPFKNSWSNVESFKKKTKYAPAMTQYQKSIYIAWVNKPSRFYFKEFFLATIVNNLFNKDIIEYEPLEFEKVEPEELNTIILQQNENNIQPESNEEL